MHMLIFCQRYLGLCGIDFTLKNGLFFILKKRMINNENFDMIMKIICIDIMQRVRQVKS